MTKIVHFPISPAKRKKLSASALQKACQLAAEYDLAVTEHRAWTVRLARATREIEAFAARALRNGLGPTDKYGDALWTLCKGCGGPLSRNTRGSDGKRIGVGFITEECTRCKGNKS